jgi:hypothetical protein
VLIRTGAYGEEHEADAVEGDAGDAIAAETEDDHGEGELDDSESDETFGIDGDVLPAHVALGGIHHEQGSEEVKTRKVRKDKGFSH